MSDDSVRIFLNPFNSTYCDTYNCTQQAKWLVGRPNPSALVMPGFLRLCHKHAVSVAKHMPAELRQHVIPEDMVLVKKDELTALADEIATLKKTVAGTNDKTPSLEAKLPPKRTGGRR